MSNALIDQLQADSGDGPSVIAVLSTAATIRSTGRHSHARGQLLGALEGLLSIGTETSRWVVPAIHAVWIPPHHHHELLSHGPFRGWSIYVAESACAAFADKPRVIRVSGLLREAASRAAGWKSDTLDERQARVAGVILDEIAGAAAEQFGLPMPRNAHLMRIAQALMADLADGRRLEDWAAWAAVPSRTLSRRFVVETGFSFTEWRQRVRLMRALEMLAGGSSVTTVAIDVGYDNISAFIAMFRRTFGVTPTRYFGAD
jgi:AraC-like DNA-binding protein